MMVPFVDCEVSAARTSLCQPETAACHPLAAVRVRNDGASGLPPGIVTAYEAAGHGSVNSLSDAQLPLLPRSTFKFVTVALGSKTDIRREHTGVLRIRGLQNESGGRQGRGGQPRRHRQRHQQGANAAHAA
jgi:hypothetical protein